VLIFLYGKAASWRGGCFEEVAFDGSWKELQAMKTKKRVQLPYEEICVEEDSIWLKS